jgi:hypothetical protein
VLGHLLHVGVAPRVPAAVAQALGRD